MTQRQAVEFLCLHPAEFGRIVGFDRLGDLHNEWTRDMICGKGDKTLQAHRGSYKTTCVSVALALLVILRPNRRILFMRKTDDDIKEVVAQVQKTLENERTQVFVKALYGVRLKLTTANAFELSTNLTSDPRGSSQLTGIGMGSSITGKHFDHIFTDDIVNIKDRSSRAERERTKLMYQELLNVRNRGGRIFNTGTPWHRDDAFSIMPAPERYDCYSTGLISDADLEAIRSGMTSSLFAANYELKHIADEDAIFSAAQFADDVELAAGGDCHVDAAYGGSDSTAFTVVDKRGDEYYVLGKLWHRHVDDCLDDIVTLFGQMRCGKIYNEDNGDKGYLNRELKERGLRTSKYHEDMNKYLKITSYLKAAWRHVHFVPGTDPEYIDQVLDYNENAEHDDAPDSLASLIRKKYFVKNKDDGEAQPSIYGGLL